MKVDSVVVEKSLSLRVVTEANESRFETGIGGKTGGKAGDRATKIGRLPFDEV
jgi:hypothetical protein